MTFKERLRALREDADINQTQLADAVHVDQRSISFYETGRYEPTLDTLIALARYFHVSTDYLLGLTDKK